MSATRLVVSCSVCAHADAHGSWPTDHVGTHCRECHRSWTAKGAAHCPVCCGHFAADATAQLHWVGGRHVDPRAVSRLIQDADGVWHMAGKRPSFPERLSVEARKPSRGSKVPAEVAS